LLTAGFEALESGAAVLQACFGKAAQNHIDKAITRTRFFRIRVTPEILPKARSLSTLYSNMCPGLASELFAQKKDKIAQKFPCAGNFAVIYGIMICVDVFL
jgi:hypothetical protein